MNKPQQPKVKWDAWQQKVLEHDGNITIRAGRQVGKSEVISEKAVRFATSNPNTTTMIIAASQRQSSLLFEKVRAKIDQMGDIYEEKPTLTRIRLINGSTIYSLPVGRTGYFIRGFTLDVLIADEAAYIPEEVWKAVVPMIAVSQKINKRGWIITLSTPFGKGGYFYDTFHDKDFRQFHVSSEDCKRIPKDFLKKEKGRLTKVEYAQEFLGEFREEWNQFFPTELIKKQMTFIEWSRKNDAAPTDRFFLGVDIARYGGDENAFVIAQLRRNKIKIVKCITTERVSTTDTIGRIQKLQEVWRFSRIFIDDAGLGGPVLDVLQEKLGSRLVLGLNNASKRYQNFDQTNNWKKGMLDLGQEKRGILKEDLYSNAVMMMETGKLELISDLKLLKSLKSITFEYKNDKTLKLFGNYSHLTEAMVRACWCIKEKGLTPFIM